MGTDTPGAGNAQVATHRRRFPPQPIDPALRMRRIKIARAFNLIGRTKCSVAVALRATGLDHDHAAREDVCDLLDRKGISRIRQGVRRVRFPETPSQVFETFIPPRQEEGRRQFVCQRTISDMVAELVEIANPLGEDVPRPPKPPIIRTCIVCRVSFECKYKTARYCGGACRIAHWRAEQ
jgi:hypothetical protein